MPGACPLNKTLFCIGIARVAIDSAVSYLGKSLLDALCRAEIHVRNPEGLGIGRTGDSLDGAGTVLYGVS